MNVMSFARLRQLSVLSAHSLSKLYLYYRSMESF